VEDVDRRLASALAVQFGHRRRALDAGAARVGWKLGIGDAERIGDEIALGHLTSATVMATGERFHGNDATALNADAEIFVEIGRELEPYVTAVEARQAIVAYGGALELVDLGDAGDSPEAIIANNIFHRAVAFGPSQPQLPAEGLEVRLIVNRAVRARRPRHPATWPGGFRRRRDCSAPCRNGFAPAIGSSPDRSSSFRCSRATMSSRTSDSWDASRSLSRSARPGQRRFAGPVAGRGGDVRPHTGSAVVRAPPPSRSTPPGSSCFTP
jgi:hypothetical protein